uniref:Uncharacterized protein n=1 Tax=Schistosoma haematobium TaxID=6185 RepID=A0A095AK11_SCHHA
MKQWLFQHLVNSSDENFIYIKASEAHVN